MNRTTTKAGTNCAAAVNPSPEKTVAKSTSAISRDELKAIEGGQRRIRGNQYSQTGENRSVDRPQHEVTTATPGKALNRDELKAIEGGQRFRGVLYAQSNNRNVDRPQHEVAADRFSTMLDRDQLRAIEGGTVTIPPRPPLPPKHGSNPAA